jgi:catalase
MDNFQRDGNMAFFNQGARPIYLSSIESIKFRERTVNLDKLHGHFTGNAIAFLSEIRPEDFNAPRNLWEKVFDDKAKSDLSRLLSGHMSTCRDNEVIKRQIAVFREVSNDLATRLENATGTKGYGRIADLTFNGAHSGMGKERRTANGIKNILNVTDNNEAPVRGTHKGGLPKSESGTDRSVNGYAKSNGVPVL